MTATAASCMRLTLTESEGGEVVHFAQDQSLISSLGDTVTIKRGSHVSRVRLPGRPWHRLVLGVRLARRALRLDKCNVFVGDDVEQNLVMIRQGQVYHYDVVGERLRPTLALKLCRNIMHQAMARTASGRLVFGEYGANPGRRPVPMYVSDDAGGSWRQAYEFPAGSIKHVHACRWDPFDKRLWVCTGDFEGESRLVSFNEDLKDPVEYGDGSQTYRTCSLIFRRDAIYWLMDSQLVESCCVRMSRASGELAFLHRLPGPVLYCKELTDGWVVAATGNEPGPAVRGDCAHVLMSNDLVHWYEVKRFQHDGLPRRLFKFGVVAFADGTQSSQDFWIFGEALKGLDGRAARCRLDGPTVPLSLPHTLEQQGVHKPPCT